MNAWTMMEQPSPGRTIGERHFIRNKRSDKWRNGIFYAIWRVGDDLVHFRVGLVDLVAKR
ncbi:hypothetical protein D3C74_183210 [compost metagenome]